jgi:hypothetical protein
MKRKSRPKRRRLRAKTVAHKARTPTSRSGESRRKGARSASTRAKSSRERVRAYRERMRKRGMKLVQVWVPDPKSPYFFAEARRQARLIAESPSEKDDQAFIDSISDWSWE